MCSSFYSRGMIIQLTIAEQWPRLNCVTNRTRKHNLNVNNSKTGRVKKRFKILLKASIFMDNTEMVMVKKALVIY